MNSPLHHYFTTLQEGCDISHSNEVVLVVDSARVLPANRSLTQISNTKREDEWVMSQVQSRNINDIDIDIDIDMPSPVPPPPALVSSRWSPPRPSGRKMSPNNDNNNNKRRQDTALQLVMRLTSPRTPNENKKVLSAGKLGINYDALPFAPMMISPTKETPPTKQGMKNKMGRIHETNQLLPPKELCSPGSVLCDIEDLPDDTVKKDFMRKKKVMRGAAAGTAYPDRNMTRFTAAGGGPSFCSDQWWEHLENLLLDRPGSPRSLSESQPKFQLLDTLFELDEQES